MARGTPKRAKRKATQGTVFPSEALARNVRSYRAIRGFHQEDLGRLMAQLGHGWSAGTVGFVERSDRAVSVDELVGLALAFGVPIGALLDPTGPDGREQVGLDFGGPSTAWTRMNALTARYFTHGWGVGRIVQEATTWTACGVVDFFPDAEHEAEWNRERDRVDAEHEAEWRERAFSEPSSQASLADEIAPTTS